MISNFTIIPHASMEILAGKFIEDILAKDNYGPSAAKSGFLTGGNVVICESRGIQQYLQKKCADTSERKIWTALPFKPLAGLLMQFAYNLSPKSQKKDEQESVFNESNLVWAIYRLLEGSEKTLYFAGEIASLFAAYQIYRPELIEAWNNGRAYTGPKADESFRKNEQWQRELWIKIKSEFKNEKDISELYKFMNEELKTAKSDKMVLPKRIFIFAPLAIAPIQLSALARLAQSGCKVTVYLLTISNEYIGLSLSDKQIASLRKKSWKENKIVDETRLYWDLGNRLIANLGRTSQVLYEQLLDLDLSETTVIAPKNNPQKNDTLLQKIQDTIINDSNAETKIPKDDSVVLNNCFSPLREVEVLCDYVLGLFAERNLTPADIAVVAPNIEKYASAIESVFGRNSIPYSIADRDIKKYDKTAQLLNLLFSAAGGRYEATDIAALFEYSMFVQEIPLATEEREHLEKWIGENAIRHGLNNSAALPNYSFAGGLGQLAAGFFMISENGFSESNEYCYPDIEGNSAHILGDFASFVKALRIFEAEIKNEKAIEEWDSFFQENFPAFFGDDKIDFNEDTDNPYQKVIGAWDSLKKEMLIGFGGNAKQRLDFSVIKTALPEILQAAAKTSYSLSGGLSFSNIETVRAVPHKVICCLGMNGKEFPRQIPEREINLMGREKRTGDKDRANEDRLMFLETIRAAKETLYISWTGQDEKTAEDLEPSSAVIMLLKNMQEQYGIDTEFIVTKHPLQPFSRKYFDPNSDLSTYDSRWTPGNKQRAESKKSVWQWEIAKKTDEDINRKRKIDELYYILSDAPRYFLRTVCNIELPEDIELLENMEPFVFETALDKWKLADLILKNENYNTDIKIAQFRGEIPNGVFAEKLIEKKKDEINEMLKLRDPKVKTFAKPSKDKGKYRLWHWLHHLALNLTEKTTTDMILLNDTNNPKQIRLHGVPMDFAENEIAKLWNLADKLKTKMRPIFPDAAWEYTNHTEDKHGKFSAEKRLSNAWEKIAGDGYNSQGILYSQYARMVIGDAESFDDLGIEKEFTECSDKLFENYTGEEVNAKT